VIDLLVVDLDSGGHPLHAVALFARPNDLSNFDIALGTFQFDFVFLHFWQPRGHFDEVGSALLSVQRLLKKFVLALFAPKEVRRIALHAK
jgi:hypothetical protein